MDEFTLIDRFFNRPRPRRDDVTVGIGDDAAVLKVPPSGSNLVVTTDMLVSDRHFPADADPRVIGYRALAVNLSDLAAMGAEPAWATLALALPRVDAGWLTGFCDGFFELAERWQVQLVGGDTVAGPLTVAVQLQGWVPAGLALTRGGARAGDGVYVTGTLGDAALGLGVRQGTLTLPPQRAREAVARFERPLPRLNEGRALRGVASAAIDISDGLVADLGHVLARSGVGARLALDRLPLSAAYRDYLDASAGDWLPALSHGDDYELCFTVPPEREPRLPECFDAGAAPWTRIGEVVAGTGLEVMGSDGRPYKVEHGGYQHF